MWKDQYARAVNHKHPLPLPAQAQKLCWAGEALPVQTPLTDPTPPLPPSARARVTRYSEPVDYGILKSTSTSAWSRLAGPPLRAPRAFLDQLFVETRVRVVLLPRPYSVLGLPRDTIETHVGHLGPEARAIL